MDHTSKSRAQVAAACSFFTHHVSQFGIAFFIRGQYARSLKTDQQSSSRVHWTKTEIRANQKNRVTSDRQAPDMKGMAERDGGSINSASGNDMFVLVLLAGRPFQVASSKMRRAQFFSVLHA